jgi:FKBP-type peptidyl-prolyl cis-trans isomerase 2
MKDGDFILIDYVGRVKETGSIFGVTNEERAKKEKVYDPRIRYGPLPVIIGAGFVFKSLENVLREMKVGEKRIVELKPEDAFGERKEELVKCVPASVFKDSVPSVGSYVSIENSRGRVLSVDGGRVKIDFNHPLAGKTLIYEIEVVKIVTEPEEKIKSIIVYFTGLEDNLIETKVNSGCAEVRIKNHLELPAALKKVIVETAFKWVEGLKEFSFVDVYNNS